MTITLTKYSSPGWDKTFATRSDAVEVLRECICGTCLAEVDAEHDGQTFPCRDANALLGTPCGSEFNIEDGENTDAA